jgi:hypothetical protein
MQTTTEITATAAYKTDAIAHGIGNSAVSNNWWNRPADERFLSLDEMLAYKQADAAGMTDRIVNTHKMKIEGQIDESNLRHGHIEVTYISTPHQIGPLINWHNWPEPPPDICGAYRHRLPPIICNGV